MKINDVNAGIEKHKKTKRVGRGPGSGHGKTAGRGHKGQGSLAGYSAPLIFQGGQSPLIRRVPKRGFNNPFALKVNEINVGELDAAFEAGEAITPESLREKHLVRGRFDVLKILGNGDVTKKLTVSAHRFSKSAQEKISAAGGTTTVLAGPKLVSAKQAAIKQAKKEAKLAAKAKAKS
jgi:large subunit ribosomal protein L15